MKLIKWTTKTAGTLAALMLLAGIGSTAFAEEVGSVNSNGVVEFIQDPDDSPTSPVDPVDPDPSTPVSPIDPTDPGGPAPGTPGPLSIDFASSFDFGNNIISNVDQVYYAAAQAFSDAEGNLIAGSEGPNYVQVTDNRGTLAGWSLSVTQNGQLETAGGDSLIGAEITLASITPASISTSDAPTSPGTLTLDPNSTASNVLSAASGQGAGTWVARFGNSATTNADSGRIENTEVSLSVPGSSVKLAQEYTTTLTWSLSDTP